MLAGLTSPEIVTGMGLDRTYTLLYPEGLLLDDDIYQRARHALMTLDVDDETLALDVVASVGPGGPLPRRGAHPDAHAHRAAPGAQPRAGARRAATATRSRSPASGWPGSVPTTTPSPSRRPSRPSSTEILAAADREIGR